MIFTPLETLEAALASAAVTAGLVAGGYTYAAMSPSSHLFGQALTAPHSPREVALTFDDGPNPRWTPMLLETLARHNVKATFFLIGKYAETQRPLVRQIHEAGHLIGNHTWSHPNLAVTTIERTWQEICNTLNELEQTIGAPVRYFRPPFGGRRPATLPIARDLGLTPVLWNALTPDWSAKSPDQVTPRMSKLIHSNEGHGYATNAVLHDGGHLTLDANRSASVAAADQLIERFKGNHRFVTLDSWATPLA